MTDEEINDAIAVECGWTWGTDVQVAGRCWHDPTNKWMKRPSYTTDLNPIADAIKGLRNRERARFNQWFLTRYEASIKDADPDEMPGLYLCNLNARELCEAFLYAHNLWRDK